MSPRKKMYTAQDVLYAIAEIKNQTLRVRQAAAKYNIPASTLFDKLSGKCPAGKFKPGPQTTLSTKNERKVRDFLLFMERIGCGVPKKNIPLIVKDVLDRSEREGGSDSTNEEKAFQNNKPSNYWVYRFLQRFPEVSCRTPEYPGQRRSQVWENENLASWFEELERYLVEEHNLNPHEFLRECNGRRVFNFDDFRLTGSHDKLKIVTSKNVVRTNPDTEDQITVLCCGSADGSLAKPFVIYPDGKNRVDSYDAMSKDLLFDIGSSVNGSMSSDCFLWWLASLFYPLISDKIEFPIIVFIDSHSANIINIAVWEFCEKHDIILYCLPPRASQPLNVSVFRAITKHWHHSLDNFNNSYRNLVMNKAHFFQIFNYAWSRILKDEPVNLKLAFRKSGIVPFNQEVVVGFNRPMNPGMEPPPPVEGVKRKKKLPKEEISYEESVGVTRALKVFEEVLSEEMLACFKQHYEEGQEILEDSEKGLLWRFYSRTRKFLDEEACEANILDGTTSTASMKKQRQHSNKVLALESVKNQLFKNRNPKKKKGIKNGIPTVSSAAAIPSSSRRQVMQLHDSSLQGGNLDFNYGKFVEMFVPPQNQDEFCHACFTIEKLNDSRAWIGCSVCGKWFHRTCINSRIEHLSEKEIQAFHFLCNDCMNL